MRNVIVWNLICQHCPIDLPNAGFPSPSVRKTVQPQLKTNTRIIYCSSLFSPGSFYIKGITVDYSWKMYWWIDSSTVKMHWPLQNLPNSKQAHQLEVELVAVWILASWSHRNWKPSISKWFIGSGISIETGQHVILYNHVYIYIYNWMYIYIWLNIYIYTCILHVMQLTQNCTSPAAFLKLDILYT